MERTQILDTMAKLKLYGMKAAYDELIASAVKRQHEPQRVVGDLLQAEISEKQARSIKSQMTSARLPLAKEIGESDFSGMPVNEALVRDLAGGGFLEQQRNAVLAGGTGTGKTQVSTARRVRCHGAGWAPVTMFPLPRPRRGSCAATGRLAPGGGHCERAGRGWRRRRWARRRRRARPRPAAGW